MALGVTLGVTDGVTLGVTDGVTLGVTDGVTLGVTEGVTLGVGVGDAPQGLRGQLNTSVEAMIVWPES